MLAGVGHHVHGAAILPATGSLHMTLIAVLLQEDLQLMSYYDNSVIEVSSSDQIRRSDFRNREECSRWIPGPILKTKQRVR